MSYYVYRAVWKENVNILHMSDFDEIQIIYNTLRTIQDRIICLAFMYHKSAQRIVPQTHSPLPAIMAFVIKM